VTITALENGTATIILRAGGLVRAITVVVGPLAPGTAPIVVAPPVGVTLAALPRLGVVFAPAAATRTIRLAVLAAPALVETPVAVTSSDPGVVTLAAPAIVHVGEQVVDLELSSGAGGTATLSLDAGGSRFAIEVVVGSDPVPGSPTITAPPVGASVVAAPSLGRIIAPTNVSSTPTIGVPLLPSPSPGATAVLVTTSDPSIAAIGIDPSASMTIDPGSQVLDLQLSIPGTEGAAVLTFDFNGQRRELVVIVGNPPASAIPVLIAPVVGVQVQ
jgi:hypothetical protein